MSRVYVTDHPIRDLSLFFQNPYLDGAISIDFNSDRQAQKFANQMRSQGNTVIICMV